ncbi:6-phosphogluconate dehydrogenase [Pseudogulbenkiania sp. MAI-1]|uniref:6-phosphogluconate dehydrogenase n=1 Tax=Pseudogulbenkiania sp. MAI-1 TaxID=990370 RepID=UPI00045EA3E8|nr:6-phosphogluconate dehydrogenase [Pseudogulbenkiania sp. MAI-1]
MQIIPLGHEPYQEWIRRRLTTQGFALPAEPSSSPLAPYSFAADWQALGYASVVLDLKRATPEVSAERERDCRAHGLGYVDVAANWQAPGVQQGFALFVGGSDRALDGARPVLDALAPLPGAWLHCGPAGSGHFVATVFEALSYAFGLLWQAGWNAPGETPRTPDWNHFFSQQKELAANLLQLSRLYLQQHPVAETHDPWQLLALFARPAHQQNHYALILARLIELALGQGLALQAIFDSLSRPPQ